eukprot:8299811-Pyramimonas_sp.AAC.1
MDQFSRRLDHLSDAIRPLRAARTARAPTAAQNENSNPRVLIIPACSRDAGVHRGREEPPSNAE